MGGRGEGRGEKKKEKEKKVELQICNRDTYFMSTIHNKWTLTRNLHDV